MAEVESDTFKDPATPDTPAVTPVRPYLCLILECDRPSAGGARYSLTGVEEVVIGRGIERSATRQSVGGVSQLTVRVPGRSMSSIHARIKRGELGWLLEDAGSTNGSAVNRRRTDRAQLQDGDVFEFGHTIFMIKNALPTPPGTPPDLDVLSAVFPHPALCTLLPELAEQMSTLAQVARSDLPVLLLGDTGTGKEVLARAIHRLSERKGAFVAVNCGAIPGNLVESQLFGHVKGSFTGATRDELGFVRSASEGTLLLDEIGDLAPNAQPALLRVLQEREVVAVGSSRAVRVDVRVVAATHRPIDVLAARDRFRPDLLARLDTYRFELPPLDSRIVDLGCIIAQALAEPTGGTFRFTPEAGFALAMHSWSSNIRELVAALRRAIVLASSGKLIESCHLNLRSHVRGTRSAGNGRPSAARAPTDAALKEELMLRLVQAQGNVAEVARSMGKARMQIHRWMRRFGIAPSHFRSELQGRED